jgi:hypothetical protein
MMEGGCRMDSKKKDSHLPDYAMVERQEMLRGVG